MTTTAPRPRQSYLDVLKGIAIFLVVMGHAIAFQVRGLDHSLLFKIIGTVHMPLFFFISGWLSYKASGIDIFSGRALWKRFKRLIIPMVAVSSLWVLYFPKSGLESPLAPGFDGLWGDMWKNGYWFTPVLFCIFICFGVFQPLLLRCRTLAAELACTAVISAALFTGDLLLAPNLRAILSTELTVQYLPMFLIGWMCRRHADGFKAFWLKSNGYTVAAVVLVPVFYIITWTWEFPWLSPWMTFVLCIIARFCIAVIGFGCVMPWTERAPESRGVKLWSLLGRKSLAIYLLHYFLLFPLMGLRPYFLAMNSALVPMVVFAVVDAAVIIAIVLFLDYLLSFSKPLSLILTGNE
ncbi:MAG: acyltransferase family protein [Bacteroidales bacterium]|nr:acyltransferase family protein [Bacteroidales bacterium]